MMRVLGDDGLPVVPVQYEPAVCAYTKAVCGSKDDMKAELIPSALGLEVVATAPCLPASGLPSTQMCNVISSPGIDPVTLEPKVLDPPVQLTANAQRELDEALASGELPTVLSAPHSEAAGYPSKKVASPCHPSSV